MSFDANVSMDFSLPAQPTASGWDYYKFEKTFNSPADFCVLATCCSRVEYFFICVRACVCV